MASINSESSAADARSGAAPNHSPHSHGEPASIEAPLESQPHLSRWKQFLLVLHMLQVRLRFIGLLVVLAVVIGKRDTLRNYWDKWTRPASAAAGAAAANIEFYCPMHPSVVRAEPGNCPICGMPLSKRKKGEAAAVQLPDGVMSRKQYAPYRIEQAGIQTYEVGFRPLIKEISTVGNVAYDETRRSKIVARAAGYIEKLYVNQTWVPVEKAMPLAEIYSPDLFSAAQELLIATERNATSKLAELSRQKLRLYGISPEEIEDIEKSRHAKETLLIRAPQYGHVTAKEVVEGQFVSAGQPLYEVADLRVVWIEADVFEKDIAFLYQDCEVEASAEAFPNDVFQGRILLIHQQVDSKTRTNRIRIEVSNPDHKLRPGMFTTVQIQIPMVQIEPFRTLLSEADSLTRAGPEETKTEAYYWTCPQHPEVVSDKPGKCPRDDLALEQRPLPADRQLIWWCPMHPEVIAHRPGAECARCNGMKLVPRLTLRPVEGEVLAVPITSIVDTGEQKVVYVEREPGLFEGVSVELGPRTRHFYPVIKGLLPGDRVATAGSFLLDAETRLNPAAAAAYFGASGGPQARPATSQPPAHKHEASESEQRKAIDLTGLNPTDHALVMKQRVCPITNLPLGSMGTPVKIELEGKTVFLCCRGCEAAAKKNPANVLRKITQPEPQ